MNESLGLKDMVRMAEFASMHEISWPAVNYLIKADKVDHTIHKGKRYVVLTEKTKRYQPNKKR